MQPSLRFLAGTILLAPALSAQARDLSDRFLVPEGFEVELWAESPDLHNPTAMDVDARGRVWVTEAVNYRKWDGRNPGLDHPGGDRVVILEDTDGDGACDRSKVFVQDPDLTAPLGICVLGDRILVSCSPNLYVYVDEDRDDVPDRRETLLTGFGGPDHDHGLHSAVVTPDGRLVFNTGNAGPHVVTDRAGWTLRSGSYYNGGGRVPADNKPGLVSDDGRVWTGGLVLRVAEDGTGLEVLAHNFRNNYEVAIDSFGNLFQSDNDDDGNASCRFLWCLEGGNHGYFSSDGSRSWQYDRRPGQAVPAAHWHQDDPGVVPAGTISGAGGPTGVAVYEVDAPGLAGAVLAADAGAGSVFAFRPRASGAGIRLEPGLLVAPKDAETDERARWFRPSDVTVAPDGSILVADWYDPGVGGHLAGDREAYGRILRISSPRLVLPGVPAGETAVERDARELGSPVGETRRRARSSLIARGEASVPALLALESGRQRFHWARALWVLAELGGEGRATVERVALGDDAELAVTALRACRSAGVDVGPLLERLARSQHPSVRREVALALRDVPLEESLELLLDLAERFSEGRYELEALGLAAEGKEEELWPELAAAFGDVPSRWDRRFEQLAWRLHPLAAVPGLAARAADPSLSPSDRRRAVDALAFVPDRAAADAVLTLALAGPKDVRDLARFWIEHRDTNDWRAYRMLTELPPSGLETAELVWSSGLVERGTVDVDVELGAARRLWLVVTDGGNGNACDWADWLEPRLWSASGELVMSRARWAEASAAWGDVHAGKNAAGGPVKVGGKRFRDAIGTHAHSEIAWDVPAGYTRFTARVAVDDGGTSQPDAPTSVEFRVYVEREPDTGRVEALRAVALDASAERASREDAARELALDPAGGVLLVHLAQRQALPVELEDVVAEAIWRNPDLAVRALASEHFPRPGAGSLPPLPPVSELVRLVEQEGDRRRGREVFFGDRAGCAQCHTLVKSGFPRGGDVGPDLTLIREKVGADGLLDSILNPSAGIAFGYDTWVVEDTDGRIYSGFLLADGADLVLKDTQGLRHVLPAEEVAERYKQSISTMPEGVALGLEPGEIADLAAFLLADPEGEPALGEPIELFDGESLEGWTYHLADPTARMEDVWSVEDDVLVCKGNPVGYLRTTESYRDFVLELEWRFDPARGPGNSGVLLRVQGEDRVWPKSVEAQLMHGNAGDIWNIGEVDLETEPSRRNGRHTSRAEPSSEAALGEWNRYRIELVGTRLTLWVNGILQNRADWCEERSGFIGLQSEGAEIHFRNVRLRPVLD